jgi:transposase
MMLSEGQMNDQKGANLLAPLLPPARELIADRGYDSNPFRAALAERGIAACIPSKKNRKAAIPYDKALYRQRHRVEIAFRRLKGLGHPPQTAALLPATTDAPPSSSAPSHSPPSSSSGSNNES